MLTRRLLLQCISGLPSLRLPFLNRQSNRREPICVSVRLVPPGVKFGRTLGLPAFCKLYRVPVDSSVTVEVIVKNSVNITLDQVVAVAKAYYCGAPGVLELGWFPDPNERQLSAS